MVQKKLNTIRFNESGNWIYLKPDGLFGKDTKYAVETFQKCKRLVGVEPGSVDQKTLDAINTYYNRVPMLKAANPTLSTTPQKKPELMSFFKVFSGYFMDFLSNLDSLIKGEIDYAIKLGKCDPSALAGHFKASSVRLDPSIKKLQDLFRNNMGAQSTIAQNDSLARKQIYQAKTPAERIDIRKAQQARSAGQTTVKVTSKQAKDLSTRYVNELKRFDLVTKISNQLKKYGITGEIKITHLKSVKIKAGGVFIVWSLKDIIWDLFQFSQWGEEKWQENLLKHCYDFLDQLIIAAISMVIAEAIVALALLAIGTTISGGVIAVIVVIVALIIGLIIGFLISAFCGEDFSFSKYIWEGSTTKIFESLYNVKLQ
jgi:hypothetical protein